MEQFISFEQFVEWLTVYGSITLFILLALGILALPIPEETLMVVSGMMIRNGYLAAPSALLAAIGGSICGITLSYLLGRSAGNFFLTKASSWLGLSHRHLKRAHDWFERFGGWALMIGYFVPGVRHFTGFAAGMTEMYFAHFALFAYLGALFWALTFIGTGYFFGEYFLDALQKMHFNIDNIATVAAFFIIILLIYFLYRRRYT